MTQTRSPHGNEFYVGYLPMPAGYRRFLLVLLPMVVIGAAVIAVVLSAKQSEPGDGTWDLSRAMTLTGTLEAEPYAAVIVPGENGVPSRRVLLVSMGKVGGAALVRSELVGKPVTVVGFPIERDGNTLMTVELHEQSLHEADAMLYTLPKPVSLGSHTLAGEIFDPKCYFGAMKPGEGKVHKACATLCIRGGIPPMFMTRHAGGSRIYYLLTDEDGRGITGEALDALLPCVADAVRIDGQVVRRGELLELRIDPRAISRIPD